jgi:hypothetical protein
MTATNSSEGNTMDNGIEVVDMTSDSTEAAPAEPVRSDDDGYEGPGVSAEGKARAQADEKAAADAGFTLKPPVYEIGRLVNQWGVDNFQASRDEYEDMPTTDEVCGALIQKVQDENRVDKVIELPTLTMLDDGKVTRGGGALPVSERALQGIASFATPGGGRYLRECPAELRAHNLNHWFPRSVREDRMTLRSETAAWEKACVEAARMGQDAPAEPVVNTIPQEVTLRTRMNHSIEAREIWSVVGPKYGAHDIDKIAQQVLEAMPVDSRADVTYDGYKARINVLFHSNVQPEKVVAGEIFKAGLMIKTADDGSGSIQIAAEVWRNLCLNLIIIDHDQELVTRRRHIGDTDAIRADVQAGIEAAMQKVQVFADKWSEATLENVLDRYGCQDIEAVFRGLVFNRVVHAAHVGPEEMFNRLMRAWQMEPGYSKTSIVNAVTRAAHENPWAKWTDVEDLERTGGELLFAKVWEVEVPEKDLIKLDW